MGHTVIAPVKIHGAYENFNGGQLMGGVLSDLVIRSSVQG